MVDKISELEKKYDDILNDFLDIVNNLLSNFNDNKRIAIENYSYNVSNKIVEMMKNEYDVEVDSSLINDSVVEDLNKVINSYNKKYEEQFLNYNVIEAILNDDISKKERGQKLDEYLKSIKSSYLMESVFIKNLNETFTKRIFIRMVNAKLNINKDDSNKILNSIFEIVKDETYNFTSSVNDKFVDTNIKINTMGQKLIEAIAQLEMLLKYKKQDNEDELEYTSRISRLKNTLYSDDEIGD